MKKIFSMNRFEGWNLSLPLIQGGMGVGVSLSGLAGAVASEGGMGVNRILWEMKKRAICAVSESISCVQKNWHLEKE